MWRKLSLFGFLLTGKLRSVSAIMVQKKDQFLIVKKPRAHHAWQFPQGGKDSHETNFQAAQRELSEECGSDLKVHINPRIKGSYMYQFPKNFKRERFKGALVSFFLARHISGEVVLNPNELSDFKWVSREEMKDYFSPEYYQQITQILKNTDHA